MNKARSLYKTLVDQSQKINWSLLLFLLLVLNVKILVKFAAIIILLLINRKAINKKMLLSQKFTWFYLSMIAIALVNLLINISSLSVNYLVAVSIGIVFWLMCAGAAVLNYSFVAKTDNVKLQNTVSLFFTLNTIVTLGQLALIMWDAGSINPFTYQGMYQKYFTSTGDRLTGISFDVSTTNAMLNALAIIYFLYTGRTRMVFVCMVTLLLTVSNLTNIILLFVLLYVFVFASTKNQKSIVVVCLCLLAIFMAKVSPQNDHYMTEVAKKLTNVKDETAVVIKDNTPLTQKPDSVLRFEDRRRKIALLYLDSLNRKMIAGKPNRPPEKKPEIPKDNIHTPPFQFRKDTSTVQRELLEFAILNIPSFDTNLRRLKERKYPGKLIAFQQTFNYLEEHPQKILTGAGAGNFASKLAFRASGLPITGGYPERFTYINEDFLQNHLKLYLTYFSKHKQMHSVVNNPNSVYDQLIAEYGLAGLAAFFLFYFVFFAKRVTKMSYTLPLFLMLLAAIGVEYWYEQLSIVILFELLMLIDIKNRKPQNE